MARAWDSGLYDITNFALALLRQDIRLDSGNIYKHAIGFKCEKMVPLLVDEFLGLHKWIGIEVKIEYEDNNPQKPRTRFYCDGDYEAALAYHIAAGLAIPVTGRQEDHKVIAELADSKLRACIAKDLEKALSPIEEGQRDEVLLSLMQNFKVNDPGAAYAWDVYISRGSAIKDMAKKEVMNAHNWSFANIDDEGAELAKTAYIELCVAKLAVPCGLDANIANLYLQKYADTLEKAKAKDLLVQAREIKDDDINHILSLIRQVYDAGDKAKPLDIRELTDRIGIFKEPSRKEVLSSYGWSFMRKEKRNPPCSSLPDGRFMSTIPGDAMKILGCFDCTGEKIEYTINGNRIIADRPPCRILYTTDPGEDMEEYPPLVRDAILLKIAESVATGLLAGATATPINASKARGLKNDYLQAVQTARTNDVKQINVGESAWGRNYLVDIMIGKRRGKWSARLW